MATVRRFRITVNGKIYEVEAEEVDRERSEAVPIPTPVPVHQESPQVKKSPGRPVSVPGGTAIEAPLPGLVLDVRVSSGETVQAGQVVVILEAMKMENEIVTPDGGTVGVVRVAKGDNVSAGDVLLEMD